MERRLAPGGGSSRPCRSLQQHFSTLSLRPSSRFGAARRKRRQRWRNAAAIRCLRAGDWSTPEAVQDTSRDAASSIHEYAGRGKMPRKGARNVYCGCDCVSACEWCVVLGPVLACKWSLFHKTCKTIQSATPTCCAGNVSYRASRDRKIIRATLFMYTLRGTSQTVIRSVPSQRQTVIVLEPTPRAETAHGSALQ